MHERLERGVYADDVTFDGYIGYKVIGADGSLLRRECIAESLVDASTEPELWGWLANHDKQKKAITLRIA